MQTIGADPPAPPPPPPTANNINHHCHPPTTTDTTTDTDTETTTTTTLQVKADPNIVIKHIKESHVLLARLVGARGGKKIGGMYVCLHTRAHTRAHAQAVQRFWCFSFFIGG